jgi:hypothetical protein
VVLKMRESVRKPVTKATVEHTGKDGAPLTIVFTDRQDGPA